MDLNKEFEEYIEEHNTVTCIEGMMWYPTEILKAFPDMYEQMQQSWLDNAVMGGQIVRTIDDTGSTVYTRVDHEV